MGHSTSLSLHLVLLFLLPSLQNVIHSYLVSLVVCKSNCTLYRYMVQISSSVINLGHQPSSPGQHCITTSSSSRISCRVARKVKLSSNSIQTSWLYHTPCNPPSPVCHRAKACPPNHWFSYSSSSLYNSVPLPTSPYHPTITWFYLAPRRTTQRRPSVQQSSISNSR